MQPITINIINTSDNPLPAYATSGSSGMDLYADLKTPLVLLPLQRELIPTGLFIEIPEGYEAQIRPRSGLAIKQGITCLNTPGTIDSDYRGEISHGDRIAQMVISKTEKAALNLVQELKETTRGDGGFGHTGTK